MNIVPQCPSNCLVVEIEQKFNEQIVTESGLQLYQDTTYRPEQHATILGKVVSLPRRIDGRDWAQRATIVPEVRVGDEVVFSYLVVFDMAHRDDRDEVYYEDPTNLPTVTQYSNRLGMKLLVRYRLTEDRFDVAAFDTEGKPYDMRVRLTESQKEEWMGLFPFAETNQISYNNLLEVDGKDYWKVDYGHVIAIRRENELIPVGGNVILDLQIPDEAKTKLVLLTKNTLERSVNEAESQVIAIGTPCKGKPVLDCKPGDYVTYDERFAVPYELWGKDVLVLKQDRLLAKR
jgi:co-chaperonin GroES (HSP10)